ncbi:alpha/beta hydrolase [Daejeonella sp.]|uniref:alpha/beta hydrolase n=1 Tax=Daejeonella sp. TaxID=2805397 RepID=UPI00273087CA|nr:alpha/beta hydrolase-fold protein [Daejeonella sp.]MDP2413142.1 alpha/beta hydrolase-fold protein [Daejeonella sp.]
MRKIILLFCFCLCSGTLLSQARSQSKPFILGEILEINSLELAEKRTLNIYLPAGYSRADSSRYPVIYLLDGSADEDFIHVAGLVQFNNFPWINRLPESIVVGIANINRKRDFTYPSSIEEDKKQFPGTGHSDKFIAFIEKELQPFIEKEYNVNDSKMIIGQSLGGLLATEILMKKPELFNKYIIISPSLWWDNGSLLKQNSSLLSEGFSQSTGIYIGVGKEGLSPGNTPHVMEMDANLLAEKLKAGKSKTVQVHFDYLPDEDHATITHQAIFNAFRLLYPLKERSK